MFPPTSRYHNTETVKIKTAVNHEIIYLRRRFLPAANKSIIIVEHEVNEGERLDNITARYLGDPQQFWRICDANNSMLPDELMAEIGHRLKIPSAQGSS